MRLAPSILAADPAALGAAVELCEAGRADLIHVDVMDGHFVPNLTFGIPVIKALHSRTRLPLDVHLMVSNPDRLLQSYIDAGAARVALHWEATPHLHRHLDHIRRAGAGAGVAVNPATPVELLSDVLESLDFVLLMSVDPGFGGQTFLPRALDKARRLKKLIEASGHAVEIAMDGGIDDENVRAVVGAGVEVCVVGSAIFAAGDPLAAMAKLHDLGKPENL